MKTNDQILSAEKFNEIYTNEKLRNAVAYAHGCYDSSHNFKHFKALCFPVEYIVTEDQITEAKELLRQAKNRILNTHQNDLLFCCMGMEYSPRFNDDVCNHRIRTEFINKDGRRFFVEFGTGLGENLRVDHSIDRDLEKQCDIIANEVWQKIKIAEKERNFELRDKLRLDLQEAHKQPYHNYAGLERMSEISQIKYTKQNILNLVNEKFGCNFKNIVIDQWTIHPDDSEIICISPK